MNVSVLRDILPIADSISLIGVNKPFRFFAIGLGEEHSNSQKNEIFVPVGKFSITACVSFIGAVICYYVHMKCEKNEDPFLSFEDFQDLIADGTISILN